MIFRQIFISIVFALLCFPAFSLTCNEITDLKIKSDLRELIFKNLTDVGVICSGQKACTETEREELKPHWNDYFSNQFFRKYSEFIAIGVNSDVIHMNAFSKVDCRFQVHVGHGLTSPILETDKNIFKYGYAIPYSLKTGLIEDEAWNYINYAGCSNRLTTECTALMTYAQGFARYSLLKRLGFARQMLTEVENPLPQVHSNFLNYFKNNLSDTKIAIFEVNSFPKIMENRSLGKPNFEGIEMVGSIVPPPIQGPAFSGVDRTPPPSASKCPPITYPEESRKRNEQGSVHLRFLIDIDGGVIQGAVAKSSGFSMLDEAALKLLFTCHFKPALQNGKSAQSWARMSFTYKLK
jgi:TonB family protein